MIDPAAVVLFALIPALMIFADDEIAYGLCIACIGLGTFLLIGL